MDINLIHNLYIMKFLFLTQNNFLFLHKMKNNYVKIFDKLLYFYKIKVICLQPTTL